MNKNWREKIGKKQNPNEYDWRFELLTEYVEFADEASNLAESFGWSFWGSGKKFYAVTLSQNKMNGLSISIRLIGNDNYSYYASFTKEENPNNVELDDYKLKIGNSKAEALEYIKKYLKENHYEKDARFSANYIMGGAWDHYLLEKMWADERLEQNKEKEKVTN